MGARRRRYLVATAIVSLGWTQATGQEFPHRRFDIPAGDLRFALRALTREAGLQLVADPKLLRALRSPDLHADTSTRAALDQLLAGSGLEADIDGNTVIIRGRVRPEIPQGNPDTTEILVTGSRIKGAPIASPMIHLTQKDIRQSGQSNLGDVIRTIPQNFGGSQNPGAGILVPGSNGTAIGSGSSIDLRGLGGDATLTLLNGHRLSYDAANQAVDVSAVPVIALDRIEIVADGASALYGSDAVAGVANIILKRDYSGVHTDVRFGASTDGGNEQQMYDIVGGSRWRSGGFMAAYNFSRSTAIVARERSYAASVAPGLTLWPKTTQHSAVVTGHQSIGDVVEFAFDGVYNNRSTAMSYGLSGALPLDQYHVDRYYRSKALSLAPSLTFQLGASWSAKAEGVYSSEKSFYRTFFTLAGIGSTNQAGCFCNAVWNGEISANGHLFDLPAGPAQIAVGAGYRSTRYHSHTTAGPIQRINASQSTYYGFAELNVPLLRQLNFSAAGRFEDYPGVSRIVTPKLGLVYKLNRMIDLKASWGRSFKAPTFYERYSARTADIYAPSILGGSGYPAGATILLLSGGNPDLKPERASTWSTTLAFHPPSIPGLTGEISYFHVRYTDRIVQPITYLNQALSDPAYARYIVADPNSAAVAGAFDGRTLVLHGVTGYDPSLVAAIIDGDNVNAEAQTARGVDFDIGYSLPLHDAGTLRFQLAGTYLRSSQRLTAAQPLTQLAGTIFNPSHVRGRAGVIWDQPATTLSAYVNYVGGVHDVRLGYDAHVGSLTTIDISGIQHIHGDGLLKGIDLSLSVLDLFNAKPARIGTSAIYETPYDSLNYSPAGRVISLSIGKSW